MNQGFDEHYWPNLIGDTGLLLFLWQHDASLRILHLVESLQIQCLVFAMELNMCPEWHDGIFPYGFNSVIGSPVLARPIWSWLRACISWCAWNNFKLIWVSYVATNQQINTHHFLKLRIQVRCFASWRCGSSVIKFVVLFQVHRLDRLDTSCLIAVDLVGTLVTYTQFQEWNIVKPYGGLIPATISISWCLMVGSQESSWWKARRPGQATQSAEFGVSNWEVTSRPKAIGKVLQSIGNPFDSGDQVIQLVEIT